MRRSFFIALAVATVLLDQGSKAWIGNTLPLGRTRPLFPLFSLTHVQNTGAAFGILQNANRFFILTTLTILLFLAGAHRRLTAEGPWSVRGLALVWGGAVGNLLDRLRLGAVADFLDVHWRGHAWPTFNVADSAICVGVGLMMLDGLRTSKSSPAVAAHKGGNS
jgi:signal peptidase II